jgi:hypothetical protein
VIVSPNLSQTSLRPNLQLNLDGSTLAAHCFHISDASLQVVDQPLRFNRESPNITLNAQKFSADTQTIGRDTQTIKRDTQTIRRDTLQLKHDTQSIKRNGRRSPNPLKKGASEHFGMCYSPLRERFPLFKGARGIACQ